MNWLEIKGKYEGELKNSVIPFWEQHCVDQKRGGYFTSLDRKGKPYDTDKYMWMQWRIVYQFASLYNGYEPNPAWLKISRQGYDFLTRFGHDKGNDDNYYFALNRKGAPISASYNIYAETFAMMGAAELFKATGEEHFRIEAIKCMDRYISRLPNPKGRWEKKLKGSKPRLSLGPHMTLAMMGLIMEESLGIRDYEKEVEDAVSLVLNHFYNEVYQVIFENINTDLSYDLESSEGRHLNPGHGLEACWFILRYAEKAHRHDLIKKTCQIIKGQLKFGWDDEFGGIYYFMDVLKKPHMELSWDMKLWWVHNEALIAVLYAYRLTGDKEFLEWFEKLDRWTWDHFPDSKYGEWYGYLNRQGVPTHDLKGGKWKTFFHLPRCLKESIEQITLIMEKSK